MITCEQSASNAKEQLPYSNTTQVFMQKILLKGGGGNRPQKEKEKNQKQIERQAAYLMDHS